MLKKLSALTVAAVLGAAAVAGPAVAKDANVLMLNWRGATPTEEAFKKRLQELGINATITELDAAQDRGKAATLMREVESDIASGKYHLVVTHGTSNTQVAHTVVNERVPLLFNIVFDPLGAKIVADETKPGGMVTGVSNGVSIDAQFDAFQKLKPIKNLVVLFNAREANANKNEQEVTEWGKKNGVNVQSIRVAPGDDSIDRALADIKSGKISGDLLYAGADSFLASKAADIKAQVGDVITLAGGTETFVLRGWDKAFAPSVVDMGVAGAEIAARILKGEKPGDIAVTRTAPSLIMNKEAAEKRGTTIPAGAVVR